MKKIFLSFLFCLFSWSYAMAQKGYPITPVPFTAVKVTPGTFWGQRLEASRNTTVPLAFSKCESEGRYKNFENAAAHMKDPSKVFKVNGVGYSFDDTDPYKTLEGAAYILQTYPDKRLEAYCDSVIDIIGKAQEPDGYLYTARTQNPANPHHWAGDRRWVKEEDLSHELYTHLATWKRMRRARRVMTLWRGIFERRTSWLRVSCWLCRVSMSLRTVSV